MMLYDEDGKDKWINDVITLATKTSSRRPALQAARLELLVNVWNDHVLPRLHTFGNNTTKKSMELKDLVARLTECCPLLQVNLIKKFICYPNYTTSGIYGNHGSHPQSR